MLSIPHVSSAARRQRRANRAPRDEAPPSAALVAPGPRQLTVYTASDVLVRPRRRRQRRVSKNCRNLLRFGHDYAGFRRLNGANVREQRMEDELSVVQRQVMELERRRALLESLHFARHANARNLAAQKLQEYYEHFAQGYNPTTSPNRSRLLESIVRSVLLDDVESPAFSSIDQFLRQWANYSKFHAKVTITIQSIQPLDEQESPDAVVVKCSGFTVFRISRDTIKHFFQPIMNDEALVQQLIGKEYCFPFVTLFHFSMDNGRVFRMEPRADLAAGLFNLVTDPFSTVKLLGASQLTSDGCLHAYPEDDDRVASSVETAVAA